MDYYRKSRHKSKLFNNFLEPLLICTWLPGSPAPPHADGWGSLESSHQCRFFLSAGLRQLQSVHTATTPWRLMLPCHSHSDHNLLHLQRGEQGRCNYCAAAPREEIIIKTMMCFHQKWNDRDFLSSLTKGNYKIQNKVSKPFKSVINIPLESYPLEPSTTWW